MPSPTIEHSASRNSEMIGLILTFLSVALVCITKLPSTHPGVISDAIHYVWLGQYLTSGEVAHDIVHQLPFPPLYPLVLGLIGGPDSIFRLQILQSLIVAGTAIALFAWSRRILGPVLAGIATLAFCILPITTVYIQALMSEPLFMGLLFATFVSATRGSARATWALASLLILTRTIGIAILPALLIGKWEGGTRKQRVTGAACAILPLLTWHAVKRYTLDLSGNYVVDALAMPAAVVDSLTRALTTLPSWAIAAPESGLVLYIGYVVFAAGTLNLLNHAFRKDLPALFFLGYATIVLVWPYPAELPRFFFVVAPLVLVYALQLARHIPSGAVRIAAYAPVMVILCAGALRLGDRITAPMPDALEGYRHGEMWMGGRSRTGRLNLIEATHRGVLLSREVAGLLPDGECAYSEFASWASFYAGTPIHHPPDTVYVPGADVATFLTNCNYLLSFSFSAPQRAADGHHVLTSLGDLADPLSASFMEIDGQRQLAAALVRIDKTEIGNP